MYQIVDELAATGNLSDAQLKKLLISDDRELIKALFRAALAARRRVYGDNVYIRGLIEVSSYCKNDCFYCGIRRSNPQAERYRLSDETILQCCERGYELGFRTFVLQGGEDPHFTDQRLTALIAEIKFRYPDAAVTLSLGERDEKSYRRLFQAGADRYLLRHETIVEAHYQKLHPPAMSLIRRLECLENLKSIGYQVGCGMMVGSPYQDIGCLIADLRFLQEFRPHMVGIGPFLPHKDTPFGNASPGSADLTLRLLAVIRLMLPSVLLPATTALATAEKDGRERGILAGANVVMPNLSPPAAREKYMLYDNKRRFGEEAAEGLAQLKKSMASIGCRVVVGRGDYINGTDGENQL